MSDSNRKLKVTLYLPTAALLKAPQDGEHIEEFLLRVGGGVTSYTAYGGWVNHTTGNTEREDVGVFVSLLPHTNDVRAELIELLQKFKAASGEQAILFDEVPVLASLI